MAKIKISDVKTVETSVKHAISEEAENLLAPTIQYLSLLLLKENKEKSKSQ